MLFPADFIRRVDTLLAKLALRSVRWLWLDAIMSAEVLLPVDTFALVAQFIL